MDIFYDYLLWLFAMAILAMAIAMAICYLFTLRIIVY